MKLRAPADSGLYELRYVDRQSGKTLGSAPIEITDPEVTVSAPASVVTGAAFEVTWTGAVDKGDYVSIVPVGSDEGTFGNYQTVGDRTKRDLTAPPIPASMKCATSCGKAPKPWPAHRSK